MDCYPAINLALDQLQPPLTALRTLIPITPLIQQIDQLVLALGLELVLTAGPVAQRILVLGQPLEQALAPILELARVLAQIPALVPTLALARIPALTLARIPALLQELLREPLREHQVVKLLAVALDQLKAQALAQHLALAL